MNKNARVILIAVVAIVLVVAGLILFMPGKSNTPGTSNKSSSDSTSDNTPAAVTITYTDNGFESSAASINAGELIKVVNNSDKQLEFDSNPHPVHTDNTELNIGDIAPGESQTFTINKKGTWGYHDHLNPSQKGSLEVK